MDFHRVKTTQRHSPQCGAGRSGVAPCWKQLTSHLIDWTRYKLSASGRCCLLRCAVKGSQRALKWRLLPKEQRKKFATTMTVSRIALQSADALLNEKRHFGLAKGCSLFHLLLTWHVS